MLAAYGGQIEVVEVLLNAGATVNFKDNNVFHHVGCCVVLLLFTLSHLTRRFEFTFICVLFLQRACLHWHMHVVVVKYPLQCC